MLQSLFGLQLPLNKVRGIFLERAVSARRYCVEYVSACIFVCIVVHGDTTFLNRIQTEVEKILWKNENRVVGEIDPQLLGF